MTVWVLTFFLYGSLTAIPGIASEVACHDLAARLSRGYDGVYAAYIHDGKCTPYQARE